MRYWVARRVSGQCLCFLLAVCSLPGWAQLAADEIYGAGEMAASRAALRDGHGNQVNSLVIAERLEFSDGDEDSLVWEAQAWLGTDVNKLWLKTEGERLASEGFEEAELQLLYSRAVSPFWDFQAGLRHDLEPSPSQSHLVLGFQGLAPYWFEMDSALFVSEDGDVTARIEAEYEILLSQRLILQPRVELNLAMTDEDARQVQRGLFDSVFELRLRYEIRREFAPYIGLSWGGDFGSTADLLEDRGEDPRGLAIVAGVRAWF